MFARYFKTGLDFGSSDGGGSLALHVAACHLRPAVVCLFIDHGANIHFRSTKYGSPLLAALERCLATFVRNLASSERFRPLAATLPLPPRPQLYFGTESITPEYKRLPECQQIIQALVNRRVYLNTELKGLRERSASSILCRQ